MRADARQLRSWRRSPLALLGGALTAALGCGEADRPLETLGRSDHAVIGGAPASPGEYPWQAQLRVPGFAQWCDGSLVHERYVLTAAHCVDALVARPGDVTITLGEHNRNVNEGREQVRTGRRIIVHPGWRASEIRNDLALIELSSAVTLNAWVRTIPLAAASPAVGANVTVTGWGETGAGDAAVLMEAALPVVDNGTCAARLSASNPVFDSMLCTGFPGGTRGSCYGDSGGPLVAQNSSGAFEQVGIVSWGEPGCTSYSVFTRVSQYASWVASVIAAASRPCTGQTAPGNTAWQPYLGMGFYADVDTSSCGYTATPRYLTSLGGDHSHWATTGATSIYTPTPTGFRVYVYLDSTVPYDPNLARSLRWFVNWQALPDGLRQPQACTGGTPVGATAWQQYGNDSLYLDINTAACGFAATPSYLTSIGGTGFHWRTRGATSIYNYGPSGFRIYVQNMDGAITPAAANANGWHLNWQARPRLVGTDLCSGSTPAGASAWQQYFSQGLYLDVNTTACGLSGAPIYVTSIGGSGLQYLTTGATSIYSPTPTGFRIFLADKNGPVTPALANARQWHINWSVRR